MTDFHAGDLVVALPIDKCSIGHPDWHFAFAHPDMNGKTYLVTRTGVSAWSGRPLVSVAGRRGRFCAGCFVPYQTSEQRVERRHRVPLPA